MGFNSGFKGLIQITVVVNVPTITQCNVVHNSDDYIRDGQRNSQDINNFNNVLQNIFTLLLYRTVAIMCPQTTYCHHHDGQLSSNRLPEETTTTNTSLHQYQPT